jgi:LCP family protein required for cell wall assembly
VAAERLLDTPPPPGREPVEPALRPTTGRRRPAPDHESDQPVPADGPQTTGRRRQVARPDDDRAVTTDDPPATAGRRRAPEPEADEAPDADQPRRGRRRATDTGGERPVGTSGTGRSVAKARSDAGTAKVPARSTDDEPESAAPRRSRARTEPEGPDERLRADHIDETLTRLTAAHAGLILGLHDRDVEDDDDAEAGDDTARPKAPPAVRVGRYAVASVALLLVLVAGLGWVGRTRLDGALTPVAAVDVAPDGVLDAAAQTGDENVLLLATDSGGSAGATTRANTVTVVHRDARSDRSVAVTLPPDLEITRPPCERWDATAATYLDQTVPAEPRTTLDSAYAVGGPRCATRAAQQVTGLAITRFVAVDLAATSALVEAVGGVQVCVERPVLDSVLGPIVTTGGTGPLNGARAAALVRAADVPDEPAGGAALVQRQERVLGATLERALSPSALLHPGRVGGLLPALGTAVVSTGTGVADLLALSTGLGEVRTVPTEPQPNSRGNREVREADAQALFAAVRTDAPLPAQDQTPAGATAPTDVTADVLNASGRDGLAAEVAGTLGDLGFRTAEVRNAGQAALDTVVRYSPDRADQAQLLAGAVPSASAVPDPGTTGVLQLVLGRSFDGTVKASAAPDAAQETPATPAVTCR